MGAVRVAVWLVVAALVVAPARGAVLVELFTAQGCSSCPPADRLLTAMGSDPDLEKQVVPLAFHVTYWNTESWHDRFSNDAWTKRQTDYVLGAGGTRRYTPQAVIDGDRQCVGSDVACIRAGVEAAAAQPQGAIGVTLSPPSGDKLEVAVKAQLPAGQRTLDVMVALYENGLETDVRGGENAHKTLRNDYVVHRLQRAFKLSGAAERAESLTLRLDPKWRRGALGVAVFLQDPKTRQVYGAASAALP